MNKFGNSTPIINANFVLKRNKITILLVLYFLLLTTNLILKSNVLTDFSPSWDEAHHSIMGFEYYKAFRTIDVIKFKETYLNSGQMYPPLYHMTIGLVYLIFGVSSKAGIYANIPFIALLIFSVYKLGSLINKRVGVFAAIITPLLPIFLSLEESVLIDYAATSIFILSFYLLFKTDYFSNTKYSVLFGISMLLSLLTKWTFIFPSLPFIIYLINSLRTRSSSLWRRNIPNLLIVLVICIPGFIWNISNSKYIVATLNYFKNPTQIPQLIYNLPHGLNLQNLGLYFYNFPLSSEGIGLGMLIAFFVAIFIKIKTSYSLIDKYLIASIAVTYIVLTYLPNKAEKYPCYIYPLVTIFILSAADKLRAAYKHVYLIIISTYVFANLMYSNLAFPNIKQLSTQIHIADSDLELITLPGYDTNFYYGKWPTKEIVNSYVKGNYSKVLIIPDEKYFNPINFEYFNKIDGKNFEIVPGYNVFDPTQKSNLDFSALKDFDYIVTKEGDAGVFANSETQEAINSYLNTADNFGLIKSFVVPDNDKVFLYSKI